jgi:hypothetical protein
VAFFGFDDGRIRCHTECFNRDALRAAGVV